MRITRRLALGSAIGGILGGAPSIARAAVPLGRGINITGWFRHPARLDPEALRRYLPRSAAASLRSAGFDFVRLAVDPAPLSGITVRAALADSIAGLLAVGLRVIVCPHPSGWALETRAEDRGKLHQAWSLLGPVLARFDPALVLAEVLNEPVFPNDPNGWAALQRAVLATMRTSLPRHTVVLTGHDWSSIAGLTKLTPPPDRNAVYTFHFYDPVELTSLAAWRAGIDRPALAKLSFPSGNGSALSADPATAAVIRYYHASGWNAASITARIDAAAEWGAKHGVPVLAGEFGATTALNAPARLAWLGAVRTACEMRGIGWALWGLDDVMGFDTPRPVPADLRLDAGVLRALGV
jgi:hypothetical protein